MAGREEIKRESTGEDRHETRRMACAEDGTKLLVQSVCQIAPKSFFWALTSVPGLEYAP